MIRHSPLSPPHQPVVRHPRSTGSEVHGSDIGGLFFFSFLLIPPGGQESESLDMDCRQRKMEISFSIKIGVEE